MRFVLCLFLFSWPMTALSQTGADAVVGGARLEPIWGSLEEEVRLRRHDEEALRLLKKYGVNRPADKPRQGRNGALVFAFGAAPVRVICAPLRVCDIALEVGEEVLGIHIGDRGRWGILPAEVGHGANATTHVVIKPHAPNLQTNVVIHTDRRVYHLELVSRVKEHMPLVAFRYPDQDVNAWENYLASRRDDDAALIAGVSHTTDLEKLNFGYEFEMAGKRRQRKQKPVWFPSRVYDDGKKTFIEMPPNVDAGEAPVLILKEGDKDRIVNYRVKGRYYVVDRLFAHAALVSGVGRSQRRVLINRVEKTR